MLWCMSAIQNSFLCPACVEITLVIKNRAAVARKEGFRFFLPRRSYVPGSYRLCETSRKLTLKFECFPTQEIPLKTYSWTGWMRLPKRSCKTLNTSARETALVPDEITTCLVSAIWWNVVCSDVLTVWTFLTKISLNCKVKFQMRTVMREKAEPPGLTEACHLLLKCKRHPVLDWKQYSVSFFQMQYLPLWD